MIQTSLPVVVSHVDPETKPFWDAARDGRFILRRCTECRTVSWYPRTICPTCWSDRTEWFEASGRGVVYSYTVNTRGEGPYRGIGEYILAYVELAEGPCVLTNIIGDRLEDVAIGSEVQVVLDPNEDHSAALIRFRLL